MISQILKDSEIRPDLFHWYGPIDVAEVRSWLNRREADVPDDLIEFWQATGGGDFFETETLLGVSAGPEWGDKLEDVEAVLRANGLPDRYLPIHVGSGMTAIDTTTAKYVVLAPRIFTTLVEYATLDDWYVNQHRKPNAERYGLAGVD